MVMASVTIHPEFRFGDFVYLKAALGSDDEKKGQVVSYTIYPEGEMLYDVVWSDCSRIAHYGFQLTKTKFVKQEDEDDELTN